MGPRTRWTIAALLAAALWCAFLAAQQLNGRASVLDRIEAPLADLRFIAAGPRVPPPDLAMVLIDEETVRWAGQFPLPRETIATLLRTIKQAGAKAIGVDILFIDRGQPEADAKLADALHETGSVIAAAAIFPPPGPSGDGLRSKDGVPEAQSVIWPMPILQRVAAVGLANVATDYDGTPRHLPLLTEIAGTLYPSLPLRVAGLAAGADPVVGGDRIRIGTATSRLDLGDHLPLRFYGPGGTIPSISAKDILTDPSSAEALRGKVVVIGAAAAGIGDTFGTPFDPVLPGVEVLATAIGNLMAGDGLVRDGWTRRIDAITVFGLPAVLLLCLSLNPVGFGFGLAVLATLAWIGLNVAAFAHGTWFSLAVPATAALPIVIAYGLDRLWRTQYSERRLAAEQVVLRRFQPAVLADRLATEPGFLAHPVTQRAALLFVDLTGFTGLAEAVGPERTQVLLGEFHHLVDQVVTEHGGLVLTFMGDGAMAVFGVPDCGPVDAAHAVDAAFALSRRSLAWLEQVAETAPVPIWVKLGAHYGPVVVSRLGGETHQHITVTGDSVNIASRLMATASQHGAVLACSADLVEAARVDGDDRHEFSDTQIVDLRGRSNPMVVRFWSPPGCARPDLLPEPSM